MSQDIPLALLSPQQLSGYVEPVSGDPDVYILLPTPLTVLRSAIDKLKNVADNVTLWANMSGKLTVKAVNDHAAIDIEFNNLSHPLLSEKL